MQLVNLSPAFAITFVYLVTGIIWILWSDTVVIHIAGNNSILLQELQSKKGIAYVLLSGILLFYISHRLYKRLQKTDKQKLSLQQKVEALNSTNPGGMIDYDLVTNEVQMNEKMTFFTPHNELAENSFLEVLFNRIHSSDKERVRTEYTTATSSSAKTLTTEFKLLGSDNNYYTVICTLFLIRNEEAVLKRVIGEIRDITQLRNLQAEYYNQQLKHKHRLASTIIKAQENERNRWAEELHDNISQMLTVVNLYLSNTHVQMDNNVTMIEQARKFINEVQQEIRLLSSSIKPPSFHSTTLKQSVTRLMADIKRIKNIEFSFTEDPSAETDMNDEQKLMAYRVIQEQLNNIIKYANASKIEMNVWCENNAAHISIEDNGNGFDTNKIRSGLGFRNIQSRLQLYNGNMHIDSSPGKGCLLSVSFQL
ncbi:sensor histidine kinase [Lacibacter cauensis]|uniref:sensor histidine kinase n=1 Tax=Lacibacter cauensis TaxID=510947 RepID=UPI0013157DC3|nr:sensor histidine kinase [Lacibacter cauensis]